MVMNRYVLLASLFLIVIIFFTLFYNNSLTKQHPNPPSPSATIKKGDGAMKISSPAFTNNRNIPRLYTCDGRGVNPPLQFSNIPQETKSLVLIMDDPDIPGGGVFDHWIVYNIDPTTTNIPEANTPPGEEGLNSSGNKGYFAACPPDRQHRYFFKLYALDTLLQFHNTSSVTKQMVIEQMQGHILDHAELIGLYNRPQNQ